MLAFVIFTTLALQYVAAAEEAAKIKMEGKSTGHGYGYGHDDGYGHGGNSPVAYDNSYQGGYNSYGGYSNRQRDHGHSSHGHGHTKKRIPIEIPYLDRNGCTYPGDVVCNPDDTDSTTYGYCVLSDEGKNLWKKPSMEIVAATCAPAGAIVLSDWCNDNERLLRAVGFIKDKKHSVYNHQRKYVVSLNPCILVAPPA